MKSNDVTCETRLQTVGQKVAGWGIGNLLASRDGWLKQLVVVVWTSKLPTPKTKTSIL